MFVFPFGLLIPDMIFKLGAKIFFPTPADKVMLEAKGCRPKVDLDYSNSNESKGLS